MRALTPVACCLAIILDAGIAEGATSYIDVTAGSNGAKADAVWGLTGCTASASASIVVCPVSQPAFSQPVNPQTIIVDDGMRIGGNRSEYVGTITAASPITASSTSVSITLTTALDFDIATSSHVSSFETITGANSGSGYSFGSSQTLTCGVSACPAGDILATGSPGIMTVVAAAIVPGKAGSGGSSPTGTCTLTSTTQIGLPGQGTVLQGTLSSTGGSLVAVSVLSGGEITNETAGYSGTTMAYAQPVNGCNFPASSAPTLTLSYGVSLEQLTLAPGTITNVYGNGAPCASGPVAVGTSDNGAGLKLDCSVTGDTFRSTVSFGTDNQSAFDTALTAMNNRAAMASPTCIYVPAGAYLMKPMNPNSMPGGPHVSMGYGCWFGDEHYHSNIFVIPNTGGDVFAWINSSANNSLPDLANTQLFSDIAGGDGNKGGSSFRNLTIIGNRLSRQPQNGLVFYGKTQFALIDNDVIDYLRGRAIWAGLANTDVKPNGDFNESIIQNSRFEHDGNTLSAGDSNTAAVEIMATGPTEGSNNLNLTSLRVYQTLGTGLWIHNGPGMLDPKGNALPSTRAIRITGLKVEGSRLSHVAKSGDLLLLGDPAGSAYPTPGVGVSDVLLRNTELANPVLGYDAFHVEGDAPTDTGNIDYQGSISGGGDFGRGAQIETCGQCIIKLSTNNTADYNLVIGQVPAGLGPCANANLANPGLIYDEIGGEATATTCIDPAASAFVQSPGRKFLTNFSALMAVPAEPLAQLVNQLTATGASTIAFGAPGSMVMPVNFAAPLWTLVRSGPSMAFSDTWDSATNILTAIGTLGGGASSVTKGQVFHVRICNITAFAETIGAGGGVTLLGTSTVPAGACTNFGINITATGGTPAVTITGL
jgi:hypothetical protein